MGLFKLFLNMQHHDSMHGWVETYAYFTGKSQHIPWGNPGYSVSGTFNEYQIRYHTAQGEKYGWHIFYPLPDPDPETIEDLTLRIRYKEKKPWIYKVVDE